MSMKKKNAVIVLIVILSGLICGKSLSVDEVMSQANQLYIESDYTSAITKYEELVSEGYEGVSLYYNLGNSYYRIGKLGYAILYYEKALKLSPNDEDVKHNLALANLRTADKIETLPKFFLFEWWETFLAIFSLQGWTIVTLVIYVLFLFALTSYFFLNHIIHQRISFFSAGITLIILLISISVVVIKLNRENKRMEGVIVENSVVVKLAPNEKGKDGFIVHEGLKILIEDEIDDWKKIRLADGKVGWIDKNQLRIL